MLKRFNASQRFIAMLLAIILAFPSSAIISRAIGESSGNPASRFDDYQKHWSGEFIKDLLLAGIVSDLLDGKDKFVPEAVITRAETAELLLKINLPGVLLDNEIKAIDNISSFKDIRNHTLRYYIEAAKNFKIISGYPGFIQAG